MSTSRPQHIRQIACKENEILALGETKIYSYGQDAKWVELPPLPEIELTKPKPTPTPSGGRSISRGGGV